MPRRHLDNGWLGQYVSGAKRKVEQTNKRLRKATTGRYRGRYSLVDPSYLPEMIVTPNRNSYLTDELGNPAISMGALRDIGGNPTIKINRQLRNNQPIYGITNREASRIADNIVEQTTPGIGDLLMGAVGKPLNLTSPSHWVGVVRDWDSKKGWNNIWEDNSGVTSKEYAEKHPWQALGANLLTDALSGKLGSNSLRIMRNIKDRNKFAYKYISPFGYGNSYERGTNLLKHILKDPSFKKGEIPEPVTDYGLPERIRNIIRRDNIDILRDEAYRKYLGLPERLGLYIDNGDGTFRYNSKVVEQVLGDNHLEYIPANEPGVHTVGDYITANGGNVKLTRKLIKDIYDANGKLSGKKYKDVLEDVWDLNPFSRGLSIDDNIQQVLSKAVRNNADKLYRKLFDPLYRSKFGYNYLGGKQLNKLRYEFTGNKLIDFIGNKFNGMEVGPLLGGKPFKMRTDVDVLDYMVGSPVGKTINYKYGGIHIDPANRGALTETMRRTGKTKYQLSHSRNPLTRMRAQFAINASHWNHG